MKGRRWHTGPVVIVKTALKTLGAFNDQRMRLFIPFVGYLLFAAALLWLVNVITPLAPFIYSLF